MLRLFGPFALVSWCRRAAESRAPDVRRLLAEAMAEQGALPLMPQAGDALEMVQPPLAGDVLEDVDEMDAEGTAGDSSLISASALPGNFNR